MRHRTGLDRNIRRVEECHAYVCEHDDCKRVLWLQFEGDTPESVDYIGCMECGRDTKYKLVDVPDDTIMLDENDDPIPKGKEDNIPVTEG